MKTTAKILPALILAASISGFAEAGAPMYTMKDLGATPNFLASSTNTTGAAAGGSTANIGFATYYDGAIHTLGTLGGLSSWAYGINSSNHVVGQSDITGGGASHAFYYDGAMHDMGTLGGPNSIATNLNSNNQVIGYSDTTVENETHAFLYDGNLHDLGTLGGSYSAAFGINENGIIVGGSSLAGDEVGHAFFYDGVMHDIGSLGGNSAGAIAISSNGIIVGTSYLSNGAAHAFLYDGTMHDLDPLGSASASLSDAVGVNSSGWVVGSSDNGLFLYDGSTMHGLDSLLAETLSGALINNVLAINDAGDIFVDGYDTNTNTNHLYKLEVSSVPIPASVWLFGTCLTGLVGLRRKAKSS